MGHNTAIEWTSSPNPDGTMRAGHSFNPWIGCTKVGPGCDHCYAERWDARWGEPHWGKDSARKRTSAGNWSKPRAWNSAAGKAGRRDRVFCASLADVLDPHASIAPEWRADLAALIQATPHLDWLLLTKRIGRAPKTLRAMFPTHMPTNLWLGASVVNQEEWDRDVPKLLRAKHTLGLSVGFLSCEPLIGPIDPTTVPAATAPGGVDWIIVGGESGPDARPMNPDWAQCLLDARGHAAGFMKQMGGVRKPFAPIPDRLHVREWPTPAPALVGAL